MYALLFVYATLPIEYYTIRSDVVGLAARVPLRSLLCDVPEKFKCDDNVFSPCNLSYLNRPFLLFGQRVQPFN